jgi:hypothetical protein
MKSRSLFNAVQVIGLVGSALIFASVGARANVLVDGNFDSVATVNPFYDNYGANTGDTHWVAPAFDGWIVPVNNVDIVHQAGGWPASPVSQPQYLDLVGSAPDGNGGTGGISQTFGTTGGQKYALSFYVSNNPGGSPNPAAATVALNDGIANLLSFDVKHSGATTTNLHWMVYSTTFIADSAFTTLSFTENDHPGCCNGGVVLDNVAVSPVPEPSTWAMMILGFLGVGFVAYRKRSAPMLRIV